MDRKPIKIKDKLFDQGDFLLIAGPCTIESSERLSLTAKDLKSQELSFIRGGAFKLRSSPNSFQGLGKEALIYLADICRELQLTSISEIVSIEDLPLMYDYVDVFLVGTRNMQNYRLLQALGETDKPVILKRGMASTIKEWILAAEYITNKGNENLIFCERGIRTFENYTRNTLDISAIPAIKQLTPYPIIVDPSHSSGRSDMVRELSWAAAAAGADGLLIECDVEPQKAQCDSQQLISIEELSEIIAGLRSIIGLWGKTLL